VRTVASWYQAAVTTLTSDAELLRALTAHARRIEVGEPTWLLSNVLRGYAGFPATLHP
jgi:hypothetical protein